MTTFETFDWESGDTDTAIALVREGTTRQINQLGRFYNWDYAPVEVLGAVLDRPDCSLGTALTIFVAAEPGYYEAFAPDGAGCPSPQIFAFLVRLRDRINAGDFVDDPEDSPEHPWLLTRYLSSEDGPERMFTLDPARVSGALSRPSRDAARQEDGHVFELHSALDLFATMRATQAGIEVELDARRGPLARLFRRLFGRNR
ncbi:hypothetical protein [Litorisediminicola beolgyonensis]|uniref:DUF4274 domain-containing protein n=1 Tax=Litorisediminicola beolgyonensis TaxID=1173614 RepID=A0ABW3ZJS7_9RHOB